MSLRLTKLQRETLAEACRTLGPSEVSRRLRLSTEAVLRLALDAGSHEGTELLAVQRFQDLQKGSAKP